VSAAQILLAWVISHPGVMAIPKAASVEHVAQNAAALTITLTVQERRSWIMRFPRRAKSPARYGVKNDSSENIGA
jgi:diketogulonate reductase-like aldo/keto reductase